MKTGTADPPANESIWIISEGRHTGEDFSGIIQGSPPLHVREYRISALSRYMLDPGPVEIQRRLVGCEIQYFKPESPPLRKRLGRLFRSASRKEAENAESARETVVSGRDPRRPDFDDSRLERHFFEIDKQLRPYDPVIKRLSAIALENVSGVVGICEDLGGNRSSLNLRGSAEEKITYVVENINRQIPMTINRSHIAEGLFDISGFNFRAFDPRVTVRLLRYLQDGKTRFCILNGLGRVDFVIDSPRQVGFLQVLQQSLDTDRKLAAPFSMCMEGKASPLRLFFNTRLTIDYSSVHIPAVYRKVLQRHPVQTSGRQALLRALGESQLGVAFNYVPRSRTGEEKLYTNLSVMHDMKALEPIRNVLPQIYTEINKRVCVSDIGRFYLLDSIKGYTDEFGIQPK